MIRQFHNIANDNYRLFVCLSQREFYSVLIISLYGESAFFVTKQCFKMK